MRLLVTHADLGDGAGGEDGRYRALGVGGVQQHWLAEAIVSTPRRGTCGPSFLCVYVVSSGTDQPERLTSCTYIL